MYPDIYRIFLINSRRKIHFSFPIKVKGQLKQQYGYFGSSPEIWIEIYNLRIMSSLYPVNNFVTLTLNLASKLPSYFHCDIYFYRRTVLVIIDAFSFRALTRC